MTKLAKIFEPSKKRLLDNALHMMMSAEDPWFKNYWTKVYVHLCKQYNKLQ
tara:strand:- start:2099 stop:2251 length:153 start_codon:yes stop_codon:yes gene_type:complete